MPPVLLDHSIYDRDRHLATIRPLLGEDLWFKKERRRGQPVPRINFYGPGLIAAIKDEKHELIPVQDRIWRRRGFDVGQRPLFGEGWCCLDSQHPGEDPCHAV